MTGVPSIKVTENLFQDLDFVKRVLKEAKKKRKKPTTEQLENIRNRFDNIQRINTQALVAVSAAKLYASTIKSLMTKSHWKKKAIQAIGDFKEETRRVLPGFYHLVFLS